MHLELGRILSEQRCFPFSELYQPSSLVILHPYMRISVHSHHKGIIALMVGLGPHSKINITALFQMYQSSNSSCSAPYWNCILLCAAIKPLSLLPILEKDEEKLKSRLLYIYYMDRYTQLVSTEWEWFKSLEIKIKLYVDYLINDQTRCHNNTNLSIMQITLHES